MKQKHFFTSESVTEGHPDKICDQISDGVLDAIITKDPAARVACETVVTTGFVLVMGEITTKTYVDIPKIARGVIKDIGYDRSEYGFDANTCAILTSIDEQSTDIAPGVINPVEVRSEAIKDRLMATGAGDQGMMFGFACNETDSYMPTPIALAHTLAQRLARVRKEQMVDYLRPDGKTQVTLEYEGNRPLRIDTIVISAQHAADVSSERIYNDVLELVVKPTIPAALLDERTRFLINPTGRFVIGGPQGDSGLTGRKIIVDSYGGSARHGGGAFSGKDPTKVDRSASYMARYIAKNIVAAKLAERFELQISYAIGVAQPISVMVETFGTGTVADDKLIQIITKVFDMRPQAIIDKFQLCRPLYKQVAAYGHFGRPDLELPWEELDSVEAVLQASR
ncbi:MAG: methionine adenosyltransferase [Symbiobacteriaceae bacterium]|nr:methionine adenosyltransferase [Symbiobacteriaceae bacterium]